MTDSSSREGNEFHSNSTSPCTSQLNSEPELTSESRIGIDPKSGFDPESDCGSLRRSFVCFEGDRLSFQAAATLNLR